jgi:DNA-binding ferritin-like protein (Dps family)
MRANIPKQDPNRSASELNGIYLQAMREISARLMDALPAGDELWQTLGQAEAMLLEAQMQGMPLQSLFGQGGVPSFCQSIVDEYRADHGQAEDTMIPASQDPSVKMSRKSKEPRGGESYQRKKRLTVALTVAALLLVACLVLWYVGLFRYWTGGSSYYVEELHNFKETVTVATEEPILFQIPLQKVHGMNQVLYDDGTYRMTLHDVDYNEYVKAYRDEETGKTEYRKTRGWYFTVIYTVHANFHNVSYVEPNAKGTANVILPDGTTISGELSWLNSGAYGEGTEFMRFVIFEADGNMDFTGAKVVVDLGKPNLVKLERISTGFR